MRLSVNAKWEDRINEFVGFLTMGLLVALGVFLTLGYQYLTEFLILWGWL